MNNFLVVLGLVAAASNAHADGKRDVETVARKAIADDESAYVAGAEVIAKGIRIEVGTAGAPQGPLIDLHGDYALAKGKIEIGVRPVKIDAIVDDARGVAWFHGSANAVANLGEISRMTTTLRVTGLAVKSGTWKVAALTFTDDVDDKTLVETAQTISEKLTIPASPVVRGDAALAKVAAAWFTGGFATGASKTGKHVAIGTSEKENAQGGAATKLAGTWDKLALAPYKIEAKTFLNGTAGFVRVVVAMPIPKKRPAPIVLTAVAVREADSWRWVALNWNWFAFPAGGADIDTK